MTKLGLIRFLLLFAVISPVHAQKVKYKDIYALLSTKQYEAAEPFLKRYIRETADNPNAYLYMGIVFQERSMKEDLLRNAARMISSIDSAVLFYDKAYKSITDKEIKKNSEFYQAYNRRDLRTGEFGVKLSDIQFDIEKRTEGLRERKDRVRMAKHYFFLADSLYKKSNALYKTLQSQYPGTKEFYLRADESVVKKLGVLGDRFDSCIKAFDQYKTSLSAVGKTSYNQSMSLKEIGDFRNDGATPTDFFKDDVTVWDYRKFSLSTRQAIERDILPTREHLITYDVEINKLRDKLNGTGVSVRNDLTALIDKLLMEQLKKYDREPLPMDVFSLKVADLEYRSMMIEHRQRSDSSDMHMRLALVQQEYKAARKLDSISTKLAGEDLTSRSADYEYFVKKTFGSTAALKNYVTSEKDFATKAVQGRGARVNATTKALRWIVIGSDSVPLSGQPGRSRFKPLQIVEEKYTTGLQFTDSLSPSGYLYSINAARVPDVKVNFPVDKTTFRESKVTSSKSLSYADGAGQLFLVLIYNERPAKDNKFPATLAKIYKSDGLAWSQNYQLDFIPREISFKSDSGEITIKGEGDQQRTMDKSGKLVK